jgi:hypothetical protein
VIRRHAVSQRVRPARVFGDVAADRARLLARRIGRVVQARMFYRAREIEIYDAGLHNGSAIFDINSENLIHAREDDENSAVPRERSTRKACPRAAANEWDLMVIRKLNDPDNIFGRARKYHAFRPSDFHRAIVFVEEQILAARKDAIISQKLLE